MHVHHVDHPLLAHKLTVLRKRHTPSMIFRQVTEELVMLLAYEATRDLAVVDVDIETPVTTTTGKEIADPRPLVVPILRAGLGMLDGMVRMAPTAEVGFLGMIRDEETLNIVTYAERLPKDLSGRHVFLLIQCWLPAGRWPKHVASYMSAMLGRSLRFVCWPRPKESSIYKRIWPILI